MRVLRVHLAVIAALLSGAWAIAAEETSTTRWCYRPLSRPIVPRVNDRDWVRNPIDAFILARLQKSGLQPAPAAGEIALLRRATYDLTGLPPTLEEIDAFQIDDAPQAYERLIDRLLASPQYGVKWGRHWLDLVRYAETDGYERDRRKPEVWRYRDYVVDSFNADKPYDRFVREQLAGDELDNPTFETIVATGYYRLGIWDDEPTDVLQAQFDDLDSILDTTARVMLGVSIGCARCHDHKGDPIPQRDYYRMLAFFRGIKPYKQGGGNNVTPENFVKAVPIDLGASDFAARLAEYERSRNELTNRILATRDKTRPRISDARRQSIRREADAGLVEHWTFDGHADSVPRDETGAAPVEIVGTTPAGRGRLGSALEFDGQDDYIRIERPVQDDFTIALWIRTDAVGPGGGDYRWFLGAGLVDGEIRGIVPDFGLSYHSNGRITAGTGKPERFLVSQPGLNDGRWHHVAFTRERKTGRIQLFVDGEQAASDTGSTESLTASRFLDIGRMQPGHNYFRGEIDDVRIYDRAVSPRGVLSLFLEYALEDDFGQSIADLWGPAERERFEANVRNRLALHRPVRPVRNVLCVMENGAQAPDTHVLIRGNPHAPDERVRPGWPRVLGLDEPTITPPHEDDESSGRRRALAEWIASDQNPLTARVMANRLWQHHFGRGIVRTPNDFGKFGSTPTHPELLDWLASEFTRCGWRLKEMHKLIMTSSAYRMSSRANPRALQIDPTNVLFWRMDMRRLAAEEIRDSILAVSGNINLKLGGPSIYPELPAEVLATASRPDQAWGKSPPEEAARRSVYIHVKRSLLAPLLTAFDLADTDTSCAVRFVSTQPTQALTMLNGKFLNDQAAVFAERLRREAGDDPKMQVKLALRLAAARRPTDEEVARGVALIDSLRIDEGIDSEKALAYFCLVVLNLNEFVYLD